MSGGFFDSFHIGTYCLLPSARDESHVRDMAECGIDLIFYVNNDPSLLDLFYKYGINAVVNGVVPGWFGADGKNAGTMHEVNTIDKYLAKAKCFTDHPAIVGIDIGDEPSSLDFPYYGRVAELLSGIFADKLLYLNIYPSYGMRADAGKEQAERELGTGSYREYLESYVKNVKLPYLSIDHYPYSSDISSFVSDLACACEVAKESERHLMVVLQVNSHDESVFLSEEQLRLEAWCAIAYGAEVISWACYQGGWWYNNVLDKDGNKTEQYEKLKTVNREIRTFTERYGSYRVTSTAHLDGGTLKTKYGALSVDGSILVSEMADKNNSVALLILPFELNKEVSLTLDCEKAGAILSPISKKESDILCGSNKIRLYNEPVFICSK